MYQLETIPFHNTGLPVVDVDGEPRVVIRHAFEQIGLTANRQIEKLKKQPWANVTSTTVLVVSAGQERATQVLTCDVRTFLMSLATIHISMVAEHVRPTLVAYQCEVARVIEEHFAKKNGLLIDQPHTWDWDEVAALMSQRFGIDLDVNALMRTLRDGGVLKQKNSPKKAYRDWFWFTGSTWNVHPHVLPKLARKVADTRKVLGDMQALQMELNLNNAISAA